MRMWNKSYVLTVYSPSLGVLSAESYCSVQWHLCAKFLPNWPKISKIKVAEHHPEILICCLPISGLYPVKKGGHRTCPHSNFGC